MLIADTNEFHPLVDGKAYAAGHAPDGTAYSVVIVRATYSTYHVDNAYPASVAQARAGGLLLGHYGYMAKTDDPAAFGRFLAQTIQAHGGLRPGDTVWVDDEETLGGDESPRIAAALVAAHTVLADPVADEGEYSGDAFYRAHIRQRVQANGATTHLWIASYGTGAPADGEDLFQFTDNQPVPGVSGNCDCSIFNGTAADWQHLFAPAAPPAAVTPPVTPAATQLGDNMQSIEIPNGVRLNAAGWTCVDVPLPDGVTAEHVIAVKMDVASPYDPQSWKWCQAQLDFRQPTPGHARVVFKGDPGEFFTGRLIATS